MRIPPETIRSLVGLHAQRVERSSGVSTAGGAASVYRAKLDAANWSEEASLLNTLKQGVKAMPDVDDQLVQQVRQEIGSGSFAVNAHAVAEGLVMELAGAM
jgi:flagellar biosynthesis anti-sigma factor FlgM